MQPSRPHKAGTGSALNCNASVTTCTPSASKPGPLSVQKNHLSARHWKATADSEAAATHQHHDQYQPPIPPQLSTLEATHPSSILRPESVATGPATVPTPMAVDQRSGLEMGRDRGTAAAANAAAADAAAAALVAAAAATKVAADAGDMTQFLAATKAAAAIAAALVTCQAATRQIGQTAASNTAAHRRGGYRPPRGPAGRPTGAPAHWQARNRGSTVRRDNPGSGGRTPAPH